MPHNQLVKTVRFKDIEQTCLRLLAMREHSQKELLNKLLVKGFEAADILAVVEELALHGWQSDIRYAESYARYRIQKGYGPVYLSYQLKAKGVDGFNLNDIVEKTAGNWLLLLEQVYIKKYGDDVFLDRKEWAKRSRFLMQRGFTGSMISSLFDQLNIKM